MCSILQQRNAFGWHMAKYKQYGCFGMDSVEKYATARSESVPTARLRVVKKAWEERGR